MAQTPRSPQPLDQRTIAKLGAEVANGTCGILSGYDEPDIWDILGAAQYFRGQEGLNADYEQRLADGQQAWLAKVQEVEEFWLSNSQRAAELIQHEKEQELLMELSPPPQPEPPGGKGP